MRKYPVSSCKYPTSDVETDHVNRIVDKIPDAIGFGQTALHVTRKVKIFNFGVLVCVVCYDYPSDARNCQKDDKDDNESKSSRIPHTG